MWYFGAKISNFLMPMKIFLTAILLIIVEAPLQFFSVFCTFLPIQKTVGLLAKIFRPDLDSLIEGKHALFSFSNYSKNCYACLTTRGHFSLEQLQKDMDQRVFTLRNSRGSLIYQGFKKYCAIFLGYAFWKCEANFKLTNHVRWYDYSLKFPPFMETQELERLLGKIMKIPWRREQSPWEVLIQCEGTEEEGNSKTMLIMRFNHVLCDGYSCFELIRIATRSDFQVPKISLSRRNPKGLWRLGLLLKVPYDTASNILFARRGGKFPGNFLTSTRDLVVSISPTMSVEDVKVIKSRFGVSYGAVLCSVYFGAIERTLKLCRLSDVPDLVSTSMVVPEENHPGGLVIHAGMLYASWPIKPRSSMERLLKVDRSLRILNTSSAAYAYDLLALSLSYYPVRLRTFLTPLLLETWKHSVDCTHLPVTIGREFIQGKEIIDFVAGNVPWPRNDMTCTSGGLNNKLRFNFTMNKGFFGSSDVARKIGKFAAEELQELLEAALHIKVV